MKLHTKLPSNKQQTTPPNQTTACCCRCRGKTTRTLKDNLENNATIVASRNVLLLVLVLVLVLVLIVVLVQVLITCCHY